MNLFSHQEIQTQGHGEKGEIKKKESRMVVGRGWGRGARQLVFNGHRVSVWEDENGDARW